MNNDLISREDIKDHIGELLLVYSSEELANAILNAIDNAPMVNISKIEHKAYNEGFKDGVDQGIKLSERPQGEWILVSERLPEEDNDYIITYKSFGENVVSKSWFNTRVGFAIDNVIAWQPLPEPYKKGSKE